jgi:hypothetical protein
LPPLSFPFPPRGQEPKHPTNQAASSQLIIRHGIPFPTTSLSPSLPLFLPPAAFLPLLPLSSKAHPSLLQNVHPIHVRLRSKPWVRSDHELGALIQSKHPLRLGSGLPALRWTPGHPGTEGAGGSSRSLCCSNRSNHGARNPFVRPVHSSRRIDTDTRHSCLSASSRPNEGILLPRPALSLPTSDSSSTSYSPSWSWSRS